MIFGPDPAQQRQWDWRAAGNFICGGGGGGLILMAALSGAQGATLTILMLAGVALVGLGLTCVWFELGRPLRALNVFINPRGSWMSREAFVATLLMPAALAAAFGVPGAAPLAAPLALGFVYCQARMLQAGKGIPAWRSPLTVPLIVVTGLAEGGGWLLLLAAAVSFDPGPLLPLLLGLLVMARGLIVRAHRQALGRSAAPQAMAALDSAGRVMLWAGTALPLAGLLLAAMGSGAALAALAGLLAALAGAWFKFVLITRAGFNQGFALVHLPVRGAAR